MNHQTPLLRSLTQKGPHVFKQIPFMRLYYLLSTVAIFATPFVVYMYKNDDNDTVKYLNQATAANVLLPANSFQHVTSAHYIEINKRYTYHMADQYQAAYDKVA